MLARENYQEKIRLYRNELTARLERIRARSARLGEAATGQMRTQAARLRGMRRQAAPRIDALTETARDVWDGVRQNSVRAYRSAAEAARRSVGPIWANRSRYLERARQELGKQGVRLRRTGEKLAPQVSALGTVAWRSIGRLQRAVERSWRSTVELARRTLQRPRHLSAGDRPREPTQEVTQAAKPVPHRQQKAAVVAKAKGGPAAAKKKAGTKTPRTKSVRTATGEPATIEVKTEKKRPAAKRAAAKKKTATKAKPAKTAAPRSKPAKKAAG